MPDTDTNNSRLTFSRRSGLSLGATAGLSTVTAGLSGCSGDSDSSQSKVERRINNPSDNLNKKGFPIVQKPITLQFMTGRTSGTLENYNKVAIWKKYEKMTKVQVDWGNVVAKSVDEKRNLALSSGDYPEAFYAARFSVADLGKYGPQGLFVDLKPLIEKYMPNIKKHMAENKTIKRGMQFPDGGVYGLPTIKPPEFLALHIQFKPFIRGDWLDKFDMDVPTTTEEFYRFLKTVKKKRPNGKGDSIGYCENSRFNYLTPALWGSFGIGNRGRHFVDADPTDESKARFFPITEGYKALVEYLHRMYSEGLVPKNIFSIDIAKYHANMVKGVYGSCVEQTPDNVIGGKAKKLVPMPALKGPDGDHTYNLVNPPFTGLSNFVITDKAKHPAETARWIDYFYSDAGSKMFFMGIEGKSYKDTGHGPEYLDKITDNPEGLTHDEALKPYVTYLGGSYPAIAKGAYFQAFSKLANKAAKTLQPEAQDKILPPPTFTRKEDEKLSSLADDIEKYVSESRDKFISGKMSLSQWNKYVEKIKQMGLDDYMEIQQAAYDRYRKG